MRGIRQSVRRCDQRGRRPKKLIEVAEALLAPPQHRNRAEADAWAKFDPNMPAEVRKTFDGPIQATTLRVLKCNWNAVQVFRLCRFERLALTTMEKCRALFVGIAAVEIECVARALSVPFDLDLLSRVRILDHESCARINA